MHSIAWNVRVKELSRMSKVKLAQIWRLGAGRNTVWTASPVEKWNTDELINDILRHEFPDGGVVDSAICDSTLGHDAHVWRTRDGFGALVRCSGFAS